MPIAPPELRPGLSLPVVAILHRVSRYISVGVAAISVLVLFGWVLDIEVLKSIIPGRVTQKPNTALGLLAISITLLLWQWQAGSASGRRRILPKGLLLLLPTGVVLFGGVTLLEYALGLDLVINRLPVGVSGADFELAMAGRPAPNTAIGFVLMGGALLALIRPRPRLAQGLSAIALFIAMVALTGHLYAVADFYRAGTVTGMAIHTSLAFVLLACGVLFATAETGWMYEISSDYDGSIMLRRMLPLMMSLPIVLGVVILETYENLSLYPEGAFALRSVLSIVLFSVVLWWNGRSLNRINAGRRRLQQEFSHELEIQVAARTAELEAANQQLQQEIEIRNRISTSLQVSEARIRQQLAEIETIYHSAPIGLNVLDADLRFVRINEHLAEINGFSVEAHLGRTVRELLPELADTAEQLLRPVIETGQPLLNIEIRGETPAQPGVERIWKESFLPIKDGDRVIGINTVCEEITERRRIQLALQAAQLQSEVVLEAGGVYPWQLDFKANRVITNPHLAKFFGLDPADAAAGYPIEQGMAVIHEADRPLVEQELQAAIAAGRNYQAEFRICPPNREEKWVLSQGKVNLDADGTPSELIGVVVDITEQKQIESAFRESETLYRTLFETIEDGFCIVDLLYDEAQHPYDHRFIDVNPAFEQQTGMYNVIGKTALEVVPEFASESHWFERYDEVLRTGQSVRFESGSAALGHWFEVHAFRPQGESRPRVAVLFREISDRKRAEVALAERAAQQAEVALIGQQALANKDLDEFLHLVAQRVARVLKVEYCKLLERLPDDQGFVLRAGVGWQAGLVGEAIVPGGHDSQAGYTLLAEEPTVVEDLRSDERFNGPKLLHQHGVISGMSTVIGDFENHPFGVIGIHTRTQRYFNENDVNFLQAIANILAETVSRHQTEHEVRQINATLERRIEERTRQLSEVNQELEAFAYSVSHDLRAPLRAVEGLANIFKEDYSDRLDETGREYIEMMISSASQMGKLIQDLLQYSRLGRREIQLAPVNLALVIEDVRRELLANLEQHQPPIAAHQWPKIHIEPLPNVMAQRHVLRQVMMNLLGNAVKFVDPSVTPTIRIWAEEREKQIRIWIEDNGIGVAPAHQKRVFQPFERLHGVEQFPGTGIGLAIVARGIERMGGKVGVLSTLGVGSRFWLELPRGELDDG